MQNKVLKNDINFTIDYAMNKDFIGYRNSEKTHYQRYKQHSYNIYEYLMCSLKKINFITVAENKIDNSGDYNLDTEYKNLNK